MKPERDNLDELISLEERLKNYSGEDEIILSCDMLDLLHERKQERQPFELIPGFPQLNNTVKHFLGGELIVVSGPTKDGKTLLAQTFTRNFSNQNHMGLWFQYEVPAEQFLRQFGNDLPIFAVPKSLKDNSLSWIIERVHEAILKKGIKYVVIDNTHNVINLTANNLSQIMGEFLKGLKRMAIKFDIVIILLHHLTKIRVGEGETIDSSLLRDSSLVAQTADTVMFVWRDKDTVMKPNRGYIKVTENRRYGVRNEIVPIVKIGDYFEEAEILR